MKNTVQILTEARDLIANGRWTQGSYAIETPTGGLGGSFEFKPEELPPGVCFCAAGAIGYTQREYPEDSDPAVQALAKAIGTPTAFEDCEGVITNWNDEKGRTREEVVAMFDKAIANASA